MKNNSMDNNLRLWPILSFRSVVVFSFLLAFGSGCAFSHGKKFSPAAGDISVAELNDRVDVLYTKMSTRNLEMQGNHIDIRPYFYDESIFYEYMDSLLIGLRQRRFYKRAVHEYVVESIDSDFYSAKINIVLYDKPYFYLFQKRIHATQTWKQTDGIWYPGRIELVPPTWFQKYIFRIP